MTNYWNRTALGGIVALVLATAAYASMTPQRADSFDDLGGVWAEMPIHYCINPANIPFNDSGDLIIAPDRFIEVVRASFQAWEDLQGSNISFAYDGQCESSPLTAKPDKVNTVGWAPIASQPRTLAAARPLAFGGKTQRNGFYRQIVEADIVVNSKSSQTMNDPVQFATTTLPAALLHEVGRFIGLDHSSSDCSIMYQYIQNTSFCDDDVNGATSLYP